MPTNTTKGLLVLCVIFRLSGGLSLQKPTEYVYSDIELENLSEYSDDLEWAERLLENYDDDEPLYPLPENVILSEDHDLPIDIIVPNDLADAPVEAVPLPIGLGDYPDQPTDSVEEADALLKSYEASYGIVDPRPEVAIDPRPEVAVDPRPEVAVDPWQDGVEDGAGVVVAILPVEVDLNSVLYDYQDIALVKQETEEYDVRVMDLTDLLDYEVPVESADGDQRKIGILEDLYDYERRMDNSQDRASLKSKKSSVYFENIGKELQILEVVFYLGVFIGAVLLGFGWVACVMRLVRARNALAPKPVEDGVIPEGKTVKLSGIAQTYARLPVHIRTMNPSNLAYKELYNEES